MRSKLTSYPQGGPLGRSAWGARLPGGEAVPVSRAGTIEGRDASRRKCYKNPSNQGMPCAAGFMFGAVACGVGRSDRAGLVLLCNRSARFGRIGRGFKRVSPCFSRVGFYPARAYTLGYVYI